MGSVIHELNSNVCIAAVESPLQMLCVQNLVSQIRPKFSLLIWRSMGGSIDKKMMEESIDHQYWEKEVDVTRLPEWALYMSAMLISMRWKGNAHSVLIGNSDRDWMHVIATISRPCGVALVDDGTATIIAHNQFRKFGHYKDYPYSRSKFRSFLHHITKTEFSTISNFTLFTLFSRLESLPNVNVVTNTLSAAKRGVISKPKSLKGARACFIGSNLIGGGLLKPGDFGYFMSHAVAKIRKVNLTPVEYRPHRREELAWLRKVADNIEGLTVLKRAPKVTIESEIISGEAFDSYFTFYSSAIFSIPKIIPDAKCYLLTLPILAIEFEEREHYSIIIDYAKDDPNVSVIDLFSY